MKKLFGVFGYPVSHSLSPVMHSAAFFALGMNDCEYKAYAVEPSDLKEEILKAQAENFCGLNLTIPLKEKIFEPEFEGWIEADDFSKKAGAVNTLHFKGGKIYGYNTDAAGAHGALLEAGFSTDGKKIVIIGAGGASKSISLFFGERKNPIKIINRTPEKAKHLAREIIEKTGNEDVEGDGFEKGLAYLSDADIIIQTTELGMGKYEGVSFFDGLPGFDFEKEVKSSLFLENKVVFDIVYNPSVTKFLKQAKAAGAETLNGEMMLVLQGALAFEIWTGKKPDTAVMRNAIRAALLKEEQKKADMNE
ncbi:MAG: shikimate dehydrogenase [Methanimicrococcus sp.]|nr:shikimate dehydrogenase [Methanimicrococcus sp.]